jgi:hypothetical protein
MDGGEREIQETDKIKHLVKETNKAKRLLRNPKRSTSQLKQVTELSLNAAEGAAPPKTVTHIYKSSIPNHAPAGVEDENDDDDKDIDMVFHESGGSSFSPRSMEHDSPPIFSPRLTRIHENAYFRAPNPAERLCIQCGIPVSATVNEREASLLMHYLDYVFPIQFPFYKPSASEGGRGWLLGIILGTRPLFHVVLSLSAYHMQSSPSRDILKECDLNVLEDLDKHHTLALTELRRHIYDLENVQSTRDTAQQVEILTCVIQLVSFEVSS